MLFPLTLRFRTVSVAPQITVTDASGHLVCYVKQKAFRLKEAVTVFADTEQTRPLYRISADRVLDVSARYLFEDRTGKALGSVQRHGVRSLWRAQYELRGAGGGHLMIREENPWAKVADTLLGEIPVAGLLTGYFFHPAYRFSRPDTGAVMMRVVKQPAFLEGRYRIEKVSELRPAGEVLAVLGALMLVLLERRRG
jgi:hypothetical protein